MTRFICPVCSAAFNDEGCALRCTSGHCFDRAAAGYVNLLRSNTSNHGDDKLMVASRKRFLDAGYYQPLRDALCETAKTHVPRSGVLLDAGCGEGYYTAGIAASLPDSEIIAVDVSKTAVTYTCKRCKGSHNLAPAVASVYDLPLADKSINAVLSVFSPFAKDEFDRVLTDRGCIISAIPLEKHLFSLKAAVYDTPYENEVQPFELDGYTLAEKTELRYSIKLHSNSDILDLFTMTPYYYKTPAHFRHRLDDITELDTEVQFAVLTYIKD